MRSCPQEWKVLGARGKEEDPGLRFWAPLTPCKGTRAKTYPRNLGPGIRSRGGSAPGTGDPPGTPLTGPGFLGAPYPASKV